MEQYWQTEINIPFGILWELLTSSRHFLRSSTALSREIAEREQRPRTQGVAIKSNSLPQLLPFKLLQVSMLHKRKWQKKCLAF